MLLRAAQPFYGVGVIPLRDINPTRSTPVVTYALLGVNVAVFLYQVSLGPAAGEQLVLRFGMVPYYLTEATHLPSFTTPVTSMFLHGGWLHLVFNMWFLHVFGDNIEDVLGKLRFVAFYELPFARSTAFRRARTASVRISARL